MSGTSAPPILPRFSDEIIFEIFEHLTDAELLPLASISKHIHDLALLAHLGRYGITETNIAAKSFPKLSTGGAFHAFRLARFITGVDALHLRFDQSHRFDRDVAALASLSRRLPRIKSIDLEFAICNTRMGGPCDIGGLLLDLIAAYRSRPAIIVLPLTLSIVRPRKSAFHAIGQLYRRMRAVRSKAWKRTEPMIVEKEFREELLLFAVYRLEGLIPSVIIRSFDAPSPLGSLIILHAAHVSKLCIPPTLRLLPAELSAVFGNLTLPLLRTLEAAVDISDPALSVFLSRHPTLQLLRLRELHFMPQRTSVAPIPPDALPKLEHLLGTARVLAWVFASPHPFPNLGVATIELHGFPAVDVRDDYRAALRGLAWRPAADTIALHLKGWAPWNSPDFAAASAPERALEHVVDLCVTFQLPSRVPHSAELVKWLRIFPSLQQVSLFNHLPLEDKKSKSITRQLPLFPPTFLLLRNGLHFDAEGHGAVAVRFTRDLVLVGGRRKISSPLLNRERADRAPDLGTDGQSGAPAAIFQFSLRIPDDDSATKGVVFSYGGNIDLTIKPPIGTVSTLKQNESVQITTVVDAERRAEAGAQEYHVRGCGGGALAARPFDV
ncbi:hypothetical protein B0H19DRAFT_1240699 [Mycena capillaripes]|nr:hypothetical protein B0H19DRAFT_1240699 [Mycena capillaripes]